MQKYVIFDMDGIIFDTEAMVIECWIEATKHLELLNFREVLIKCIGTTEVTTMEIFKEHYPGVDLKSLEPKKNEILNNKKELEGIPVKFYVRELLEFFVKKQYKIALASSTVEYLVTKQLKGADLYKYFDVVVGGDNVLKGKPAPDIFLLACEKLGCDPKDALVIEDSINGIKAAKSAKCTPIMVPDLVMPPKEFDDILILKDLHEVFLHISE